MRPLWLAALVLLIGWAGCGGSDAQVAPVSLPPVPEPMPEPEPPPMPEPMPEPEPEPECDTGPVQYRMEFRAVWDSSSHGDVPPFPLSAHFSRVVGATHHEQISYWSRGGIASPGIESMAETGGVGALCREIRSQSDRDWSSTCISIDSSSFPSPGSASLIFNAEARFPVVTLVSMIAPSPDWFVGVDSLELMEDGCWRDQIQTSLRGYDAGTDSGATFTAGNADVTHHQPIGLIRDLPEAVRNEPFATLVLTRQ